MAKFQGHNPKYPIYPPLKYTEEKSFNMLIRVIQKFANGDTDNLGTIEADEVPATGDAFWWKTHGPFEVTHRTWHFPAGFIEEKPELVTLTVEQIRLSKPRAS
ncbi:MAG: hypothetical protein ACXIU7_10075 [Roseinatronobacter sp.]